MKLFVLLALSALCAAVPDYYTVFYNEASNSYSMDHVLDTNRGVCWGSFDLDSLNATGWSFLSLTTNANYSGIIQSTAAGYLEGALTHDLIYDLSDMFYSLYPNNSQLNEQLTKWTETHITWLRTKLTGDIPADELEFWDTIGNVMAQLEGLTAGYNKYSPNRGLNFTQLFMLNGGADLMDVMMSLIPSMEVQFEEKDLPFSDHCSALVLPIFDKNGNLEDLFVGHTTWSQYNQMLRVFKRYDFNASGSSRPGDTIGDPSQSSGQFGALFSSYPSFLFSGDDYYLTSGGLLVMETTNSIFNGELYNLLQPEGCVLTWMRDIVANKLATTGREWASIFSMYNSGTYNNQWIIVDYKEVASGQLQNDTVWILEQIPGKTESADVTDLVRSQGYWPSYNIPFFEDIYNASGYGAMETQFGDLYDYSKCPRANIFRRDFSKVRSMSDMKSLMQYNDWQNDPLSLGSPANSISSRFDLLNGTDAQLMGGIDSKVTSLELFKENKCWVISGPTHQQQPVFYWSNWTNATINPHDGQPDSFDFDWIKV